MTTHRERPLQVGVDHSIPILSIHFVDQTVPRDPRRCDNNVNPPERVQRRLHNLPTAFPGCDRIAVCNGIAAGIPDDLHDIIRRGRFGTVTAFVHHNLGTVRRERNRDGPANALTGPCHYCNFVI